MKQLACSCLLPKKSLYFNPLKVIPWMIFFWKMMNTRNTGIVAIKDTAIN